MTFTLRTCTCTQFLRANARRCAVVPITSLPIHKDLILLIMSPSCCGVTTMSMWRHLSVKNFPWEHGGGLELTPLLQTGATQQPVFPKDFEPLTYSILFTMFSWWVSPKCGSSINQLCYQFRRLSSWVISQCQVPTHRQISAHWRRGLGGRKFPKRGRQLQMLPSRFMIHGSVVGMVWNVARIKSTCMGKKSSLCFPMEWEHILTRNTISWAAPKSNWG